MPLTALFVPLVESWMASASKNNESICARYATRFGLDFSLQQGKPCANKLRFLTEMHLATVPFDNLRLHGAASAPVSMEVTALAHQLLDRRRGGLCFELNGLFGELLTELGYDVSYVPATMLGVDGENIPHLTLLVNDCEGNTWFTDVGMGEPPLHPLAFVMDDVQETPDNMKSRLREDDGLILLEWYCPEDSSWETRLKFSPNHTADPQDFEGALMNVLDVDSCFRRKPVACKITRQEKVSLVGNTLKRSHNRFRHDKKESKYEIETLEKIQNVLHDEFGIPREETLGLNIPSIREYAIRL